MDQIPRLQPTTTKSVWPVLTALLKQERPGFYCIRFEQVSTSIVVFSCALHGVSWCAVLDKAGEFEFALDFNTAFGERFMPIDLALKG
eukprot:7127575-Karenia_brevis.AAC.1